MLKAYKYQLFPTPRQKVLLDKHFGCVRFIWNWGLTKKIEAYQKDKTKLSRYDLQKLLPLMKKQVETQWLSEVNAQSLQAKLIYLDEAFVSFFKQKNRFPKFQSKKNKQSFHCPQKNKIDFTEQKIFIPKFKQGIKFDCHRKFEGEIRSTTVSKSKQNKYYISILVEDSKELPAKPEVCDSTTLGIDLGLTHFATLSTGEKIDNPKHLKNNLKKLRRESRKLYTKKKGSKNSEKQRIKLSKIHAKVSNSRKDFHHKLSHKLTHDNQVETIVMETLGIKDMLETRWLAQQINDASWGQFAQFLKYKCDWYGKNLIQIGRYELSSKICDCGSINSCLRLTDRFWTCNICKRTHDRDILAAQNIKKIGLGRPEFTSVESNDSCSVKQKTGCQKSIIIESQNRELILNDKVSS